MPDASSIITAHNKRLLSNVIYSPTTAKLQCLKTIIFLLFFGNKPIGSCNYQKVRIMSTKLKMPT